MGRQQPNDARLQQGQKDQQRKQRQAHRTNLAAAAWLAVSVRRSQGSVKKPMASKAASAMPQTTYSIGSVRSTSWLPARACDRKARWKAQSRKPAAATLPSAVATVDNAPKRPMAASRIRWAASKPGVPGMPT